MIPVAVVGLALKDFIEVTSRSLWVIAGALILWSGVMWLAEGPTTTPEQVKERASLMLRSWQAKADRIRAKIETIAMVYGVSAGDIEAILEETSY